jgi:hypothetical protein
MLTADAWAVQAVNLSTAFSIQLEQVASVSPLWQLAPLDVGRPYGVPCSPTHSVAKG